MPRRRRTGEADGASDDKADGGLQWSRDNHIGRLFLKAHRAFAAETVAKLQARGHARLTLAHAAVLPHLDVGGTSITALADRAGMTKQSMRQVVLDLEAAGYVARVADPDDQRATRVTFTADGRRFLHDARDVKREIEAAYLALLGREPWDGLVRSLDLVVRRADAGGG